ncbi:MAG: bifunctional phosphoribosylaminoimidazolecarboxamide formyltransferase/IMP cyclohydrolase [Ancalomicrobiaceae bacterium]|nr:bifunctional phosphoribosylaminoimidazolecarboxamide formyltransferase/IMP cyclohydrolase [Ancalomicrobiaceae bacterium]
MLLPSKHIPAPDHVRIRRALLSVFDKTGLEDFAKQLAKHGVELISTGGTAAALKAAGLAVTDVSDLTGFPEILDGRVKTLHPKVHGGILAVRGDDTHLAALDAHGIGAIDLLVSNLYPFVETVASGADADTIVENIDIGGPAMIRAAAKNHAYVTVVVDPADYRTVIGEMQAFKGETILRTRKRLALKAFGRTATYDAAIANWMTDQYGELAPAFRAIGGKLIQSMRYGENPHQPAALYRAGVKRCGVTTAKQIQGKELSYNNINDTDAAYELVAEFDPKRTPAVAIIKHANPCGVAEGATLKEAYERALMCDPVSAYGGIIALNRQLDAEAATEIIKIFTEVIIAPDATEEALKIVATKKNLRLLLAGGVPKPGAIEVAAKTVAGGLLVQSRDFGTMEDIEPETMTKRKPSPEEMLDLEFAWRVVKHVKSNAIVYAKNRATVGIGAGQMSRVDAAVIAGRKAEDAARAAGLTDSLTKGSVAASDAFFPFADGLDALVEAGATAVIQPGGSMRDEDVIAAADAANLAMVFTRMRHFRH